MVGVGKEADRRARVGELKEIERAFVTPEHLKDSQRNADHSDHNGNGQQHLALGPTKSERGKEKRSAGRRAKPARQVSPGLSESGCQGSGIPATV